MEAPWSLMRIVFIWTPIHRFAVPFDNMYEAFVSRLFGCQQLKGFIKVQGSVSRNTEANFVIEQRTITNVIPSEFHNSGSI